MQCKNAAQQGGATVCRGFLGDCRYHFGNRFEPFEIDEPEEDFRFRRHPMFYRFNRYIPRRRMWMGW